MRYMDIDQLMDEYKPGSHDDDWTWSQEFEELLSVHVDQLDRLSEDIQVNGILQPILLDDDGRVWDGHHRIVVAFGLGFEEVPVENPREHHERMNNVRPTIDT